MLFLLAGLFAVLLTALGFFFFYRLEESAKATLEIEKADKVRLQDAQDQVEREKRAMANIQAALGSGQWSMEFDANANLTGCVWTNTFRKMLGYTDETDFPNRLESWSELLHEEDRAHVLREYWDTVRDYTGEKTYDVKYRLFTKNAGWRWFHAAGRLSRRKDGSPVTFVGFFIDIDDNKKLEAQLEAQRKDLENALAAAQHASRAKTTFLNNMSHDIRTPMNAIIGYTALASAHIDDREQALNYLKKVSTSGRHLLSLINDVLDMSRIESGKMKLEEETVCLQDMMHDIETIVRADVASKQLDFHIDTTGVINGQIMCDRLRLNQILLNLLSNAIKFTGQGGTVGVDVCQKGSAPQGYAAYEFQIRDTGIGIAPEFLDSVFEPFERERTSTVSGIQGTGLGMAITKNIVDMMGGSIAVKSEKGKGTTFTVVLQFRICSAPVRDNPVPTPVVDDMDPVFVGKRILLVEDNEMNQEIAAEILENAGLKIDIAANGAEAVERVRQAASGYYDLVLMDIQMPVMNGYEATRQIRALENRAVAEIPILAMTADAFYEDRKAATDAGMDAHIAKPIDFKKLLLLLREKLEESGTRKAPRDGNWLD